MDASFAVHPAFKSHTGTKYVIWRWQGHSKICLKKTEAEYKNSTKAELVREVDNISVMISWTKLFLEAQGYRIDRNILVCKDNKRAILLEENGKKSSPGIRAPALNIIYLFLTGQVEKGNVIIEHCLTKPWRGQKFCMFCYSILGTWSVWDWMEKVVFEHLHILAARR